MLPACRPLLFTAQNISGKYRAFIVANPEIFHISHTEVLRNAHVDYAGRERRAHSFKGAPAYPNKQD
jgi:hypothetical protein